MWRVELDELHPPVPQLKLVRALAYDIQRAVLFATAAAHTRVCVVPGRGRGWGLRVEGWAWGGGGGCRGETSSLLGGEGEKGEAGGGANARQIIGDGVWHNCMLVPSYRWYPGCRQCACVCFAQVRSDSQMGNAMQTTCSSHP